MIFHFQDNGRHVLVFHVLLSHYRTHLMICLLQLLHLICLESYCFEIVCRLLNLNVVPRVPWVFARRGFPRASADIYTGAAVSRHWAADLLFLLGTLCAM